MERFAVLTLMSRTPTRGLRGDEAAMTTFAKSWRRQ
jgi:hypothetical protein